MVARSKCAIATRGTTSRSSMSAQRRHPRHQRQRVGHTVGALQRAKPEHEPVCSSAGTRWEAHHEALVDSR